MNLYTTRNEAIEREIRQPLAAGLKDLLTDGGTVEDYYDVDAIADETTTTTATVGGQPRYCLDPTIYPGLFWEIVERHARPAVADPVGVGEGVGVEEEEGPVALAARYASRQDRGLSLDENGYTARLLSTVPRRTTPLGYARPEYARPGYVDLLALAAASAEHARWLGYSDPDGGIWGALAEEAEEVYQCLAGRTDPERLSDLASEIGTWLTDGGEPATLAVGGLALAWAAALLED